MPKNDTSEKGWPNLSIGLTFCTAVVFLASLLFLSGFSLAVGRNLLALCDLTDYVRIAPSWGMILLGGFVIGALWFWGSERPKSMILPDSWRYKEDALHSRIVGWLSRVVLILGIVCSVAQFLDPGTFWASLAFMFWPLAIFLLSARFAPGWVDWLELPPSFARLLPIGVFLLAFAFFTGVYFLQIFGPLMCFRTITMKDHSKYEGRVVLDLNRYVVIQTAMGTSQYAGGKLTALQSSEIQAMDLFEYFSQGTHHSK